MENFSVLLSLYYKETDSFLRESLDSVFNQTRIPNEIILVEDGPLTPELYATVEFYANKYPQIKVVPLEKNGGLGAALNEGLKHCTNELVARMDTDDICKPYRFERQLKEFELNPKLDVCGSWIDEFIDDIHHVKSQRRLPEKHEDIFKYAKGRCPVNHPTVMYKKSKVLAVNGYQGFPEDIHLWVKMLMNNCQFYNIQESLLWFRTSPDLYKRRGGWKYAKQDANAQWSFYKYGFISFPTFIKNTLIRCSVRIMPNQLRAWIYNTLLRKKK